MVTDYDALANKSWSSGDEQESWELTNVVPVFKNGDKSLVSSDGPITLISMMGKLSETAMDNL